MSEQQWQNLPMPPERGGQGWDGFSADPRKTKFQSLRASDADRGNAATMLSAALAEGRLDSYEYDQRLGQVMKSKTLGELLPILGDVTPDPKAQAAAASVARQQKAGEVIWGMFPRWWLGLALMLNAIWLMTCLTSGRLIYYWPMWPMLGTAIPMIMGLMANGGPKRAERTAIESRQQPPENDLR
ncbi:DUF1707 SHOCT-like domain-containing protein [Micropruina sonneratiae]|uniref:DUF1707 SHOCT-like domain-containing protein n=1 Tax=Micropruina sonneratiae TaxID=2986940 RepID=UPI0022262382|nr:DUF1707 domain-containing protein [Micropruina sp. KQZ13P-5]MCW3159141.1 DUF1707 domain-containing protein [Micropruina sp. KQZ13P-5]